MVGSSRSRCARDSRRDTFGCSVLPAGPAPEQSCLSLPPRTAFESHPTSPLEEALVCLQAVESNLLCLGSPCLLRNLGLAARSAAQFSSSPLLSGRIRGPRLQQTLFGELVFRVLQSMLEKLVCNADNGYTVQEYIRDRE